MIKHSDKSLSTLFEGELVSHYAFLSDTTLLIYLRHKGQESYHELNLLSGELKKSVLELPDRDGHPTVAATHIVTDTYPNIWGQQKLVIIDKETKRKVEEEYNHPPYYFGPTRCDLHPRIDEGLVLFDTVSSGRRKASLLAVA